MARTLLMTGVSGFLGSTLAASLLEAGDCRILSLAPDDETGETARAAVGAALRGLGSDPLLARSIEPVVADLLDPVSLASLDFSDVDEVWHVAARMSYALDQLNATVDFNVNGSLRLMAAVPAPVRVYHVSTTGIVGPGRDRGTIVPEALVDTFEPLNPYTISKQFAEQALFSLAMRRRQPLTILRPGSIIGNSLTGWSNGTRYGYYSYLQAFKRYLGRMPAFAVAIDPDRIFPVIHVDHLARACRALSGRDNGAPFEVFNLVNERPFSVAEHFRLFEALVGGRMKITFGDGENAANRAFNTLNADNNRFMGTRHRFQTGSLAKAVGAADAPPALTGDGVSRVISHYLEGKLAA